MDRYLNKHFYSTSNGKNNLCITWDSSLHPGSLTESKFLERLWHSHVGWVDECEEEDVGPLLLIGVQLGGPVRVSVVACLGVVGQK